MIFDPHRFSLYSIPTIVPARTAQQLAERRLADVYNYMLCLKK